MRPGGARCARHRGAGQGGAKLRAASFDASLPGAPPDRALRRATAACGLRARHSHQSCDHHRRRAHLHARSVDPHGDPRADGAAAHRIRHQLHLHHARHGAGAAFLRPARRDARRLHGRRGRRGRRRAAAAASVHQGVDRGGRGGIASASRSLRRPFQHRASEPRFHDTACAPGALPDDRRALSPARARRRALRAERKEPHHPGRSRQRLFHAFHAYPRTARLCARARGASVAERACRRSVRGEQRRQRPGCAYPRHRGDRGAPGGVRGDDRVGLPDHSGRPRGGAAGRRGDGASGGRKPSLQRP